MDEFREFEIPGMVSIASGRGDLPVIRVSNTLAEAEISIYGGQVLSYRPCSEARSILFISEKSLFQVGKASKAGIPICWPWFGPDPEGKGRPQHGFTRT
mmetsp:Transcript_12076/g.24594  ORF Transcript_12076/g.24594 Transcript_12076/m.24594 type:complete len:99 (+) Transcript_12076:177-473(+)